MWTMLLDVFVRLQNNLQQIALSRWIRIYTQSICIYLHNMVFSSIMKKKKVPCTTRLFITTLSSILIKSQLLYTLQVKALNMLILPAANFWNHTLPHDKRTSQWWIPTKHFQGMKIMLMSWCNERQCHVLFWKIPVLIAHPQNALPSLLWQKVTQVIMEGSVVE